MSLPEAMIVLWLAAPHGQEDDGHRATLLADAEGAYRFENNAPTPVPHIRLRVTSQESMPQVTQQYPEEGATLAVFDVVLVPVRRGMRQ